MKTLLNTYWNIGTAMGEVVSALLLTYLILAITFSIHVVFKDERDKPAINFILKPVLYVIGTLIAVMIGTTVATSYSGPGQWFAQSTTTFAWITSIHAETYKALPFIFASHTIGSIIGYALFVAHVKAHNVITEQSLRAKDFLMLERSSAKQTTVKHTIIYTIMAIIIVFMMRHDLANTGMQWGDKIYLLMIMLIIPIAISSGWGFFIFSPNMAMAGLLYGYFYKEVTKKEVTNVAIATALQILIFGSFAYGQVLLEVWGGKFHFG